MNTKIDFVLTNGLFVTMDKSKPRAEAIAINDGKIIAVGTVDEIEKKYKHYKKKIDLKGKFVCPGFNDAHTHLLIMSAKFLDVMLDKVTSANEALEKIRERVQDSPKGKWIFGERWDESNWDEKRYITLDELDNIAPENPCFIRRVCGHLASLNTLALKELEIPLDDPDLEKDPETGKPTGVITEALMTRIFNSETSLAKLEKTQEDLDKAIKVACEFANSLGVTSITDNLPITSVKAYMKAWEKNELTIRVLMNIPKDAFKNYIATGLKTGYGDPILRLGGVKLFTDGSIGARTAALKVPYFDDPTTDGQYYIDKDIYYETIKLAIENGWQTASHAIGDRAIDMVLTSFEKIGNPTLIVQGRHRIEHAEYLTDDLLERANKLGITLSMQPNFPGRWGRPSQLYEIRLGPERYKLLNNFRKILDSNAKVCFGSDNMPMNPLLGIWSIVTHQIDEINITIDEAIYHYTLGGAYSSWEEDIKGSIEVGKVADIIVLEKNLYKIDPDEIKDVKVSMTFFDGKLVYEK